MLAVVLYSLAVSVKMNVLLMAPGVLAVLLKVGTVAPSGSRVGHWENSAVQERRCNSAHGHDLISVLCTCPLSQHARPVHVVVGTVLGVVLQVALGAPFLAAYPGSYLARAFELTRVRHGARVAGRHAATCE